MRLVVGGSFREQACLRLANGGLRWSLYGLRVVRGLGGRLWAELVRIAYRLSASTLPGFPDIWAPELVYA